MDRPWEENPVSQVKFVRVEEVVRNEYNPNSIPKKEFELLYTSIKKDGYTQPVVVYYNDKLKKYVIVDGFHRYLIMREKKDIYEKNLGMLPVVVIEKNINERMASTIRHNRARGNHAIVGMSEIVLKMVSSGMASEEIRENLGMEEEEFERLKYVTGVAKLFEKAEYSRSYLTTKQIKIKREYESRNETS